MFPNGVILPRSSVNTLSEYADIGEPNLGGHVFPLVTENKRCLPSGDHDSGTCSSPSTGVVRRSALPPSTGCHQIAWSPSRPDWNVIRRLSFDQIGKRLLPPKVS